MSVRRKMKKILVVGANFINKGAQSMLFIVTDEIIRRYPDAVVYFGCNGEKYKEKNYKFIRLLYTNYSQKIALANVTVLQRFKTGIINLIRFCLRKSNDLLYVNELKNIVNSINLIIDISGYALGEISTPIQHEYYLNSIRLAKKNDIPIILMPQSFGPFNYSDDSRYLLKEMKELLPYCQRIYARENEGFRYLEKYFALENIFHSTDLVLQNKILNKKNICNDTYSMNIPDVHTLNNVAIIPNYHCFEDGCSDSSYKIYQRIINILIKAGKNVYIFRHATLDYDICKKIYYENSESQQVYFIEQEFDCLEYDEFIRNFDFIICSRYHGCVHAYKNLIPCIILGWAVKYLELAKILGQEKYIYNITSKDFDEGSLFKAIQDIMDNYLNEKIIILEKLTSIQQKNCFDILDKIEW